MSTNNDTNNNNTNDTMDTINIEPIKVAGKATQQGIATRLKDRGTVGYDRAVQDEQLNDRFDDIQFAELVGMPEGWTITLSARKGVNANAKTRHTNVHSLAEIGLGVIASHIAAVKADLKEGQAVGRLPKAGADRARFCKANFKMAHVRFDNDGLITSEKTLAELERKMPRSVESQARKIAKAAAAAADAPKPGAKFVASAKSLAARAKNVELDATEKAEALAAASAIIAALTK